MKIFDNIKDFCRFIDTFEGELVIRNNKIFHNGIMVAKRVKSRSFT